MNDIAIKVEDLSKRYRIGKMEERHDTLVGALGYWVKRPVANWRRLRSLSKFDAEELDESNQRSVEIDKNTVTKVCFLKPKPSSSVIEHRSDIIWALKDVSFEVCRGEVLGIIGRNGAGKSTLLKILSRITHPTSGRVELHGRVSSLLEVGTGFHPELTGRDNIYLNGTILGMTRVEIDRKYDEIVDFSGVEQFIDTPVKRYSSGMRVRLAFSVAAHLEPEILLIDEVLAVGDAEFQKKCLNKMDDISQIGRTVIFVSHNMAAIRRICSNAVLIASGQIAIAGKTENVIRAYLDESCSSHSNLTEPCIVDCDKLDHSGSGEARIIWAEIKKTNGNASMYYRMDEAIEIVFGVDNPYELNLDYAVEILDQNDYPLFHFLSEYEEREVNNNGNSEKKITISITIPPLNLFPDKYYVNLWVGLHHARIDKVEKCLTFQIDKNPAIDRELLVTRGRIFKKSNWLIHYHS